MELAGRDTANERNWENGAAGAASPRPPGSESRIVNSNHLGSRDADTDPASRRASGSRRRSLDNLQVRPDAVILLENLAPKASVW